MEINTNVYGTSDSWYYSPAFNSTLTTFFNNNEALLNAFKASPPKTVNFGGTDNSEKGMLSRGISENKTPANVAIDNSIVAIGQDPAVSPFGKMKCVQFVSRSGWTPTRTITEIEKTTPINVFFATWQGASSYYDNMTAWAFRVDSNANSIWSPDSNATNNPNMRVFPIASYGAKSLLLTPMVFSTTNDIGGAQNGNWRTLNAWRDNYSNEYVYAIALKVQVVNSITASTIGYGSTGFSTTQRITAALWDSIGDNDNTHIDYCFTYDTITAMGNMLFLMKYFGYNASVVQNQITTHWQGYFPNVDLFDHCEFKQTWSLTTSAVEIVRWGYKIGYSDNNYNVIMKWAALFGAPFTPTGRTSFGTMFNDSDLYFPIIDNNGIGHGEYTHGTDNLTNPFNDISNSRDINYNPSGNIDPNSYSDHTTLPALSDVGQYYWTDKTLGSLDTKINIGNIIDVITDLADNPYNEDFIFQEPLKCVLDYRRIFLTQPWVRAESTSPIVLGRFYSTDANKPFVGYADPPRYRRVTLGSWSFYRTYDNFLDFEPYTQAFLYVPFCGVKKLPMDIFSGHTVNVYMNADNCTGELQVLIFVDNIEWGTMSGMASEELPLISEEALTASNTKRQLSYQRDMIDMKSNLGVLGSLAGASISAAMHNPLGVMLQGGSALLKKIESSFEIGELNYQINHTVPDPLTIQKGNASIDKCNVLYPFVMLQTPKFINAETDEEIKSLISNYGKTKGFKCCLEGTIGDFNGFTKCSNAILDGISCTYTEKTMILQALQDGVIL